MKVSNIWRLLKILLIFSRKHKVKAREIAQELEISTRQAYRDINSLKFAGIPIYSDRSGFSVLPDFFMPKISLEIPEVLTLFLICSAAKAQKGTPYGEILNSAFDKILNALPSNLKQVFNTEGFERIVDFGIETKIDYKELNDIFDLIYQASIEKRSVSIKYFTMENKKITERVIDPYAFKLWFGIWYLVGYCHLRGEVRTFRVDRIREVGMLDKKFIVADGFDLDKFFEGSWGIVKGKKCRVKLKFSSEIADFVGEINWHPSQKLAKNVDGTLLAEFEVMGLNEIKIWILGFGKDVEVLEPAELRENMREIVCGMQGIYQGIDNRIKH